MRVTLILVLALALALSLLVNAQDTQETTPPAVPDAPEPTVTPPPAAGTPPPASGTNTSPNTNTPPPTQPAPTNQGGGGTATPPAGSGNGTQPTTTTTPAPQPAGALPPIPANASDILTIVAGSKDHQVLAALVEFANTTDDIADLNEVSFFAPLDRGFQLTLRDLRYKGDPDTERTIEVWKRFLANSSDVINATRLLKYHAMPGRRTLAMLKKTNVRTSERRIQMVSRDYVELEDDGLRDEAKFIPNPNYTTTESAAMVASNGIIHNIDRVLLYDNFDRDALAKKVQAIEKQLDAEAASVCFPSSATVQVRVNGVVRQTALGNLKAGHEIHVDELGSTSRVFLFTHRRHYGMYKFTRLTTKSGHTITLSGSHYLYANGRLTAARAVRVGHRLRTVSGESAVVRVESVVERGLIAPHTMHGDVLVDGVVASSYTTAVHPRVAGIMLAPLRAAVRLGIAHEPVGALFYNGADNIASFMPRGPEVY